VTSSNIFIQPTSQFRVLETVPDVLQPLSPANTNQHSSSHIAGAAAIENTDQATSGLASTSTYTSAEVPQTGDPIPTPGLASTSTSTSAEVPQTGDPIPTPGTPPHASTSIGPDPIGPAMSATTTTPCVEPAVMKALYLKRYQHKSKMEPGVAVTAR
jgi:hypothetical protein